MKKTIKLTTAQALLRFLNNQYVVDDGVEYKFVNDMFGIFGHGSVLGIGQALQESGHNIRLMQGHNEQNMAHAAIAFAKQNNRRQIIPCLSSIGPGALNMVTAAGTATANRIPLLLLTGDTFASRQPDPVLQQIEQEYDANITANNAFKPVVKYWDRISRPEQLISAMMNAMRVLTSRSETGAVNISLPQDSQTEAYDYPTWFFEKRLWYLDRQEATNREIEEAVEMINLAKKPIIIAGGGIRYSEAGDALIEFVENYNIPFGETQAGKGVVGWEHPLNLGGIGVTGGKAANVIAKDSDLIIAIGTRLGDFTTASKWLFKEDVPILSINVNKFDSLKMNSKSIIGDARTVIKQIDEELDNYKASYKNEIKEAKEEWNSIVDELYTQNLSNGFSQTRALGLINELVEEDAIIVGASGSLPGDLQRVWRTKNRDTYHVEYGFSCMGYEVNGAFGARLAKPDVEVYSMCGDGSYLMGHSELYTAVQERQKINIMLFDNNGFGCIENLQNEQGSETFGTVFKYRDEKTGGLTGPNVNIDFAKNAESYGCKAYTIHDEKQLIEAFKDSKKYDVPVLFDIKVLPKTMTAGYDSWWRVGVSEVSENENVNKAFEKMSEKVKRVRDF